MTKNLSVVLPVYNAEATLRNDVIRILDVAAELAGRLRVFIVDDGSIDDTYDTAIELATRYPQVRVTRHAQRVGLGKALDGLRGEVAGDFLLVHDGASRIDAEQIRQMWLAEIDIAQPGAPATIDDLHQAVATHAAMAAAHARLAGFQRLVVPQAMAEQSQPLRRRDRRRTSGVGVIPPLPRPNFVSSLANFALGE